jgi:AMP-polyphosphate phosphotransferase
MSSNPDEAPKDLEAETKSQIDQLSLELGRLQREARSRQLPIMLLIDGWEASGKGTLINQLAAAMDPRGYRVVTRPSGRGELALYQPFDRHYRQLPGAGEILIVDQSWYDDLWRKQTRKKTAADDLSPETEAIVAFERALSDGGLLLVKCFLDIPSAEQKKRFAKLVCDSATAWRIDEADLHQLRHRRRYRNALSRILEGTSHAPRQTLVVAAKKRKEALVTVLQAFTSAIREELQRPLVPRTLPPVAAPLAVREATSTRFSPGPNPLDAVDLNQSVTRQCYEEELGKLQARLNQLEHLIYRERIPVVMLFEGWDAAGKGGSIRRLVAGLDPRGYEVMPVAAPTELEKRHHYLWRFMRRMPRAGHITLFDRSWYGRVLVERVEGFCAAEDWRRAFAEIAAFEKEFVRQGGVLLKFWFHIDQQTQLERFQARQADPGKEWKITDEDWRNRAKWDAYEVAVADMLVLTHTQNCPWSVVPGNDKLFARLFTLQTAAEAIERRLEKRPK